MPIAVETSGVWDTEGLNFIRKLGSKIADITKNPKSISYFFQRISIAVQRGNVASIHGTLPSGRSLDEIYLF